MNAHLRRTPVRALLLLALSAPPLTGCMHPRRPATVGGASTELSGEFLHVEVPPLPARDSLPEEAREMLRGRMLRHGEEMIYLLTSVLLLDYADVARTADRIASFPKLGRPAPGETDTLNALLPPVFFDHQDDLSKHARSLAQAARMVNDKQLGQAFAALTTSCVSCHAAYLGDEEDESPPHDEPEDRDLGTPDEGVREGDDGSTSKSGQKSSGRPRI